MSPLRCPVCRATLEQGPQCRRCRADLSLLFALEDQRRGALREAYRALRAGAVQRLLTCASRADALRHDDETARLTALGHLLQGNFAAAWLAYGSRPPTPAF